MVNPPTTDEGALPSWGNALTTIAACGGVGAFIDFYIGKRGQQRVRDWLETWWLRLSYVHWDSLGREEARFAVQVMDRLFGKRLFSAKRWIMAVAISVGCCVYLASAVIFSFGYFRRPSSFSYIMMTLTASALAIFLFAISFSVTRFASQVVACLFTKSSYLNFVGVILLFLFQYLFLCYWVPITEYFHAALQAIPAFVFDPLDDALVFFQARVAEAIIYIRDFALIDTQERFADIVRLFTVSFFDLDSYFFAGHLSSILGITPSLIRFLVMTIFIGSFLLQPLKSPIMTLWAHVIENDKPMFTLVFGGTAAVVKAIQEVIKIFW